MTTTRAGSNRRFATVALVATLITCAAALPLALIAWDARNDEPASGEGLVYVLDGSAVPLHQARFAIADQPVLFQMVDDDLVAMSWALYEVEGAEIAAGVVAIGPPFEIDVDRSLQPGMLYDLLITGTLGDGSTVKRAARFEITDLL